jgi:hypothetical protein
MIFAWKFEFSNDGNSFAVIMNISGISRSNFRMKDSKGMSSSPTPRHPKAICSKSNLMLISKTSNLVARAQLDEQYFTKSFMFYVTMTCYLSVINFLSNTNR